MTKYQEIISYLKDTNPTKAEYLEEEIDIIIHKLKFITEDGLPKTIILDQRKNFNAIDSEILAEKVNIAGGRFITTMDQNPDCIIIRQINNNLYGELSSILASNKLKNTKAFQENNIFIIQEDEFDTTDDYYLKDIEILAEILQPKYFVYGHNDTSWVQFDVQ